MTERTHPDETAVDSLALFEDDLSETEGACGAPETSARQVADSLLQWAIDHHAMDSQAITAQSVHATPATPHDGSLFGSPGQGIGLLRQRQIAGVLYNEVERCVYVLTRKKIGERSLKLLPCLADGVVIKYLHYGYAQAAVPQIAADGVSHHVHNGRYCCGSSIYPARHIGAGTFGALLRDAEGELFGLSANHVSGLCSYAECGEKILAPGHLDISPAGIDPFTLGTHVMAMPMTQGTPPNVDISQNSDAAVFRIGNPDAITSWQGSYYDTPVETADPQDNMRVEKVGRTTGYTRGRIIGRSPVPSSVEYIISAVGGKALVFFDGLYQIVGENGSLFSTHGDSGALVTAVQPDGKRVAVGLLIAGTQTGYTLMLPIRPILEKLRMTLTQHGP